MERLSISLPAEMVDFLRAQVAKGRFASNSEVVSEALREWESREAEHERRVAVIRQKIADADADPAPSLTDEEVGRYFEERFKAYK